MNRIDVGGQVAGLHIDAVAGAGGSSVVYRATDRSNGETKAVKVLRGTDLAARRRLQREAALLARLDHPGVVPFEGFYEVGDECALITQWIDGHSLRDHVARGEHLTSAEVCDLLDRLSKPLDYLHANDIVHRDLSPSNIMIGPHRSVTLIDLGIGHTVTAQTMTSDDLLAGTPRYLAPEIIRGETATERSDQYSIAVVLYELLSGQSPFPDSDVLATALHHQVHTTPPPVDEINPSVPAPVTAALARALEKDPSLRFASMADFAAAASRAPGRTSSVRSRGGPVGLALAGVAVGAAAALFTVFAWPSGLDSGSADIADGEVGSIAASIDPAPANPAPANPAPANPAPANPVPEDGGVGDEVQGQAVTPSAAPADDLGGDDLGGDDLGGDDLAGSTVAAWTPGLAAALNCNLLAGSDFATGSVPLDYFGDPPGRERVVEQGGFGDTWALEIGQPDNFGQFAEIVPVVPGQSYWFRGWFERSGQIEAAEMGITLLDSGFTKIGDSIALPVAQSGAGFAEVELANVPPGAAFALPYLFKDSSPGVLLADELVFGTSATCFPEISAGG